MLLDGVDEATRSAMFAARDGVGGFTPLAVSAAWRNWAITLPRLLAASHDEATGPVGDVEGALRTQALDGASRSCVGQLPPFDGVRAGYPLLPTADALANCGFLGTLPKMLLDLGADLAARDDANRTVTPGAARAYPPVGFGRLVRCPSGVRNSRARGGISWTCEHGTVVNRERLDS